MVTALHRLTSKIEITVVSGDSSSVNFTVGGNILLTIRAREKKDMPETTKNVRIGNRQVPIVFIPEENGGEEGEIMETYWDDTVIGVKTIAQYLSSLFRKEVSKFGFGNVNCWHKVNDRQDPMKMCYIEIKSSDMRWNTNATVMSLFNPPNISFSNLNSYVLSQFHQKNGESVTIDDLKSLNSENINIGESRITNADANGFMKHWMAGGSARLKFLRVEMKNGNLEEILSDLEVTTLPRTVRRMYKIDGIGYKSLYFLGGNDIRREDNVVASVVFGSGNLYMVVWPDAAGFTWDCECNRSSRQMERRVLYYIY